MKIIRFKKQDSVVLAALTNDGHIYQLPFADFMEMSNKADAKGSTILALVNQVVKDSLPLEESLEEVKLLVPIEAPEVWGSGVTYEISRKARNEESVDKSSKRTFYDKVYDAERPEIFFKSTKDRTVGPNDDVYIRSDSNWQIPEPELGLVVNKHGNILGYTIGNDMSSRDIEGENPLYLTQAKIWRNSCSIGPAIVLAESVEDPYNFEIVCRIYRNGEKVAEESANTRQLKRKYEELVGFLVRDNIVFDGTVLLTGTAAVPPNDFSLQDGDQIEIEISGIGKLVNPVKLSVSDKTTA